MLPIIVEKLTLSAEARKFLPPAPAPTRTMAARGLAPLAPAELITVQVVLTADAEEPVAAAARQHVAAHPEPLLKAAAEAIKDAAVLDYLSYCAVPPAVKQALLLNKAVADETLLHVAKDEKDATVLDVLSNNQQRMLAKPEIAENLIENPALTYATKKRLEEFFLNDFADKFLADTAAAPAGAAAAAPPELHEELAAALAGVSVEDEGGTLAGDELIKSLIEEKPEDPKAPAPAAEEAEKKKGSLYKQILGMRVSQKIKLALKGNKEARSILVKDSNKMVCSGVLKNSRITDGEIITIASSKSTLEDLLRIISVNPAWMRNYNIRVALLNNGKTPFAVSQKLIGTLHDRDVEAISKSRNVSGALKQMAERMVRAKQKKPGGGH